jgi:hypothetical protein
MVFLCCAPSAADNTSSLQPASGLHVASIPLFATLPQKETPLNDLVLWLDQLRMTDPGKVGGKNASLGELISQLAASGVRVPGGFATTAQAFDDFLAHNKLAERGILAADLAQVGHAQLVEPKHQVVQGCLLKKLYG